LAIDAAAWRWISDRTVLLAPADGPEAAACVAIRYRAQSLVLEPAHFSAYQSLYDGTGSPWFGQRADLNGIRVYSLNGNPECLSPDLLIRCRPGGWPLSSSPPRPSPSPSHFQAATPTRTGTSRRGNGWSSTASSFAPTCS